MTTTHRRWQNILSVLTNRDFVLLWLGEGLASLGIMTLRITLVNLIYERTASASGVSLLILTHTLAVIFVTPFAGVLVDRFDRKKWLIGIGILRALIACIFVWTRAPWSIYLAHLALVTSSMLLTPAMSAAIPDIVEKDKLLDANALLLTLSTVTMIVGPLLGGYVTDRLDLTWTVLLCGALYLLGPLFIVLVRLPPSPVSHETISLRAVVGEFLEGLRYIRGSAAVSGLIAVVLLFQAGSSLSNSLSLPFAERVLLLRDPDLSPSIAYGYMRAAVSSGLLAGSLLVRYLGRRFAKKHVLLAGLGWIGLTTLALVWTRSLFLALVVQFVGGAGSGLFESLWSTLLQENVEGDKLGRSFGLFMSTTSIFSALTVYLGGWLADRTSVLWVFALSGVCVLLTAAGGGFLPGYRAIPARTQQSGADTT